MRCQKRGLKCVYLPVTRRKSRKSKTHSDRALFKLSDSSLSPSTDEGTLTPQQAQMKHFLLSESVPNISSSSAAKASSNQFIPSSSLPSSSFIVDDTPQQHVTFESLEADSKVHKPSEQIRQNGQPSAIPQHNEGINTQYVSMNNGFDNLMGRMASTVFENQSPKDEHSNKQNSEFDFSSAHPSFFSKRTDVSYLRELDVPKSIAGYTFYSHIYMKLSYHALNTIPLKLTRDPANRQLLFWAIKISPLYDFLNHAFMALSALDLYYQQISYGTDEILDLNKSVYLMVAEYHMKMSIRELTRESEIREDTKKAVALVSTSFLHTVFATFHPDPKIATRAYFNLGKNSGVLFVRYAEALKASSLFKQGCSRYVLNNYSRRPSTYTPCFLYGLLTVSYNSTKIEPDKKHVLPLNNDDTALFIRMLDRLDREYRAYANTTVTPDPIYDSRTPMYPGRQFPVYKEVAWDSREMFFETDFYGTLSRYTVEVPDRFIDFIDQGDPRALIIIAYNIVVLVSRGLHYLPIWVFYNEIDYIEQRLDEVENSEAWKSWLLVAREALGMSTETAFHRPDDFQ